MLNLQKYPKLLSLIVLVNIVGLVLPSCKKDPKPDPEKPYEVQAEARDSAYYWTKDVYLWTELLPTIEVFKPRNLPSVQAVMDKVRTYQPLDRFSFVETKEETERTLQGLDMDFGFLVKFFRNQSDLRINYVYQSSPGGTLGVKRGWKILKINGRTIDGSKQSDIDFLNDVFFGTGQSADFEFLKLDGTTVTLKVNKGVYPLNTVLYRNVYTSGAKKAGYFVFNQFSRESSVSELINTFNYFQSNGVNEMIVDLRYNRGGFVSTQDTLANMLAPQSVGRGQNVMYRYVFNQKYTAWNEVTYFYKSGTLNLSRIVFIVTPSSASASELLINNLRPVITVKLIGDRRTYGKPVGFFPIPVFDYTIYPVSFKTVNSLGDADYYQGFNVDKNTLDDLDRDFGDVHEASLKEALNYVNTGNFTTTSSKRILSAGSSVNEFQLDEMNADLDRKVIKFEIEHRTRKMPKPIRDLQKK